MIRDITIVDALVSLRPGAEFTISEYDYDQLIWHDQKQTKPSREELEAEVARLKQERIDTEYQRQRAAEYPDFRDYLDGIVKGDQAQIQAYIDACLAIKEKYPKPGAGS